MNFLLFATFLNFDKICPKKSGTINIIDLKECCLKLSLNFNEQDYNKFQIYKQNSSDKLYDYNEVWELIFLKNDSNLNKN